VPEYELGFVRIGAPVTIRVRSLPGRTFEGRVALLYPQVAEATRTARVRVELTNADGSLLPNMYAERPRSARARRNRSSPFRTARSSTPARGNW
jgi:multidrug efflux pump subunit AcrA (membrane-fusion protein)